ncbi:MAG: hypothetical protein ACFFFT_00465 [Candidatus Thorarchaeota archaeon]
MLKFAMKDLNEIPEFSRYFRVILPSKIKVDKEEIFYRDKYNDIINYIKSMSTFNSENVLKEYISPKGTVLINVNPGTDILEFIKLISLNYSLEIIEFNDNEIKKAPEKFIKSFIPILRAIIDNYDKEIDLKFEKEKDNENIVDSNSTIEKKILLINQQSDFKTLLKNTNLLKLFSGLQKESSFNFIEVNIILIWINYDIQDVVEISSSVYDSFDLFIKVQLLDKIERETVFRDFLEKNPKIVFDINALVNYTDNWEVKDIKQLLKVGIFKHFLNSELNETSNEITYVLLDLIDTGEFLPTITLKISNEQRVIVEDNKNQFIKKNISKIEEEKYNKTNNINEYLSIVRESRISEFMLNQLYENAASVNYNELLLIIDKIDKKEPLEENDRKILAKYPFILNEAPNKALINLEKAKKRVDRIRQAFGK